MRAQGYAAGYQYPHDDPDHFVSARYLPEELGERRYYEPDGQGAEVEIARRLAQWRRRRQG